MLGSLMLTTWVLLAQVSTFQCQQGDCRPVRASTIAPHQVARFASQTVCHEYRERLAQMRLPDVHPATRPTLTIKKQITYTCQEGDDPL